MLASLSVCVSACARARVRTVSLRFAVGIVLAVVLPVVFVAIIAVVVIKRWSTVVSVGMAALDCLLRCVGVRHKRRRTNSLRYSQLGGPAAGTFGPARSEAVEARITATVASQISMNPLLGAHTPLPPCAHPVPAVCEHNAFMPRATQLSCSVVALCRTEQFGVRCSTLAIACVSFLACCRRVVAAGDWSLLIVFFLWCFRIESLHLAGARSQSGTTTPGLASSEQQPGQQRLQPWRLRAALRGAGAGQWPGRVGAGGGRRRGAGFG